jgi:hypothetical protein
MVFLFFFMTFHNNFFTFVFAFGRYILSMELTAFAQKECDSL